MASYGTKIKKRLKTLRDELKECIEPQCGLLTRLVSSKVLSMEEFVKIQSKGSDSCELCVELLQYMQRKKPIECEKFIVALIESEQQHVTNYVQQKARRYESDHSEFYNWPLEQFHRDRIIMNWDQLVELIECDSELIDVLFSRQCINRRQLEIIMETASSGKTEKLLTILLKRSIRDYNVFVEFFKESEHTSYLARLFEEKASRYESDHSEFYNWPLEQFHRDRIIMNWDQLVELIECDSELIDVLFSRSIRDYNVFVEFFKESEHTSYLARLFEEKAIVETVDCSIASTSAEPVSDVEDVIINTFRDSIQSDATQRRDSYRNWIRCAMDPNTELVAMKKGNSIRCFFFCGTPDALQSLYISINNGSLITTMQWMFQQMFGCEESIFVMKTNGRLNLDEQKKRVAEFCTDIGSVNSNELSKAAMSGFKKPFMLPYEVLEPILLQVAITFFKKNQVCLVLPRPVVTSILQVVVNVFKRNTLCPLLPRPDIRSMLAISRVCKDWFQVITGRKTIRQRLKLTFRKSTVIPTELFKAAALFRNYLVDWPMTSRDADVIVLATMASVCRRWWDAIGGSGDLKRIKRLFHYNPQLLITLSEPPPGYKGRPSRVQGVVMLDKFVYVVYNRYSKVEVFDGEDFEKVEDIEVEELEDPGDMVGSSVTSQLFISDWRYVILRVDLQTGVSDWFIKLDCSYARLSLVENRLLVTLSNSLLMYDIHSAERIQKIPLTLTEDWMKDGVRHAIESNRDSFFVSHGQSDNYTVSEIDSEGRVIRVFNNEQQLDCGYLALDSVGRLLVTDVEYEDVVVLDEHLKFKRILGLIDTKRLDNSQPWRLNYNKNNNRLAVGLWNGQVQIFECNKCYCE